MSDLVVWSAARGEWLPRSADEITWLDRTLLSGGRDQSLHRPPRCPGLRYVHRRWELFSRDTTHRVYVATFVRGTMQVSSDVESAAQHILPAATPGLEAQPIRLEAGAWVVGVGKWVLPICVDVAVDGRDSPTVPVDELPATMDVGATADSGGYGTPPAADAAERVARYFQRNSLACLAIAFYYQDFIRGSAAPHAVPIADVAVALDLSSDAAVSEYKKELQRRIWNEQGHQRDLSKFLLEHGLITLTDLQRALEAAAANEAAGRTELARTRLRYGHRQSRQ